jgi:hypothetical protein
VSEIQAYNFAEKGFARQTGFVFVFSPENRKFELNV